MQQINCVFTEPIYYRDSVDLFLPVAGSRIGPTYVWNYSKMNCTTTGETIELISTSSTGASFYIDKKLSYGEILVLTFLLLFAIFGIVKVITDFWIPHRVIRKS